MMPSDGELIQRIVQKDYSAFEELFKRYHLPVFRFISYLCKNKNESEDLFQETWLKVVKKVNKNTEIKNFKSWIFTIAVNTHRDELRKKKVRRLFFSFNQVVSESGKADNEENKNKVVPSVTDNTDQVELSIAIRNKIKELPDKQRRVFVLKEIEGFKHREIGKIMKIPEGTVKSLLHRAVKFLQNELHEFQGD